MLAPAQLDNTAFAQQGFRFILKCGIGVMLLFCLASFATLAQHAGQVEVLSAAADSVFTITLIAMHVLLKRLQLGTAALILAAAILLYCIVNLLLFPHALIRVISQPMLAIIVALGYVNSRQLRALSVAAWLTIALIFWLSDHVTFSKEPVLDFAALCAASAILLLLLGQFHARMSQSLAAIQEANSALHAQRASLEDQVAERTASLQQAMDDLETRAGEQQRLLAQAEQQRGQIRALSLPILPIDRTTLAAPLIGIFDSQRLAELQQQVLVAIERSGAKTLVLDITGVPTVDQQVALGLLQVAQAARLLGARVVLAGIRPEVAQSIVGLGMELDGLDTTATFEDGIALAARSAGKRAIVGESERANSRPKAG